MAVTLEDIAATLLLSTPAEDSATGKAWTLWVSDARAQVKARLGDLDLLDQPTLDLVIREAVALKAKRPDPVVKIDVQIDGEGSTSKTYERSSGQVIILDEWWDWLTPDVASSSDAFTINPFGRRWH